MKTPEISIIIPIYQVEKYLPRCLDSILAQTFADFELILVDDGSTDNSGVICDSYSEKDKRILVLHQQNAGVSAARNAGLDAAQGEYIGFVDADDWVDTEMFRILHEDAKSKNTDIVMCDAVTKTDGKPDAEDTLPMLDESCMIRKNDWSPALLAYMAGAVWRCLYKMELIKDLRFPVGIKISEDRLFNLQAMGKTDKLYYDKRGLYYRYVRLGSACYSYHNDLLEVACRGYDTAVPILEKYWGDEYIPIYTHSFIISNALQAIYQICSKACPVKGMKAKVEAIGKITENTAIQKAFELYEPSNIFETLLRRKSDHILWMIGSVVSFKRQLM